MSITSTVSRRRERETVLRVAAEGRTHAQPVSTGRPVLPLGPPLQTRGPCGAARPEPALTVTQTARCWRTADMPHQDSGSLARGPLYLMHHCCLHTWHDTGHAVGTQILEGLGKDRYCINDATVKAGKQAPVSRRDLVASGWHRRAGLGHQRSRHDGRDGRPTGTSCSLL